MAPLLDFLIAKVCTHGPIDKDQLRAEAVAAGYFEDGNGRTFHTTLMNIVRGGKVIQCPDHSYAAPPPSAGLFNKQEGEMQTMM